MFQIKKQLLPCERLTKEPEHNFFGYYDLQPWSGDGRYHLCHRVAFRDRMQAATDVAELGLIDMVSRQFIPFARTYAWNFQQGAMLQWHPQKPNEEVIFNTRVNGRFTGAIFNLATRQVRLLSYPVANVDPTGRYALGINFSRLFDFRPGYGYAGIPDPNFHVNHPEDDGIFLINLEDGSGRLIISYRQMADFFTHHNWIADAKLVVNHITFNTDGSRFVFLVRNMSRSWQTSVLTAAVDGSDIRTHIDFSLASHYHWRDPEHLLIWARVVQNGPAGLFLIDVRDNSTTLLDPAFFTADGHCSYSPDGSKLLYDSYPDQEGYRHLYLYDLRQGRGITLAVLRSLPNKFLYHNDMRCDLHPRWNRTGTAISFDSIHEDHRHVYWMEIPESL